AAQHVRPWLADHELAACIRRHLSTFTVYNLRHHAEKRQRARTWLCRDGPWQRRDHDAARLRLPPGVDDRTALPADDFVIPNPGFGIDRLTDSAEQTQRTQVMLVRPFGA